jgi:hypothetical protein
MLNVNTSPSTGEMYLLYDDSESLADAEQDGPRGELPTE